MRHQEAEYTDLRGRIAGMGDAVSRMVSDSVRSLVERDDELARDVIQRDDSIDHMDVEIDEHCLRIFALYEPKAIDLRFIIAATRIIVDLERIGDHCVDICKEVLKLNRVPQVKPYIDLPRMGELAAKMVVDSVNAYLEKDADGSISLIRRDDEVDHLNNQILRELVTYLVEDLRKNQAVFSLMLVAKGLERIADYTTNIAENVYFMVSGNIIRHIPLEEAEHETDTGH
ncbi:MAG: phosphate transport system regulatory protein PhoU [Acidobacteria bacterium]|nr:MAG: phosphate transport system regulatory protein PhoU [Acidobacteriota bacterium]